MGENKTAVEQYAELQLKKHQAEQKSKMWISIIVFALVIIGVISNLVSNAYLNSDTAKKILEKTFNSSSNQYISYDDNGYMLIGLRADSRKSALLNLRKAYVEMSKKQVSSSLDKIAVVIYDANDKVMLNSNITVKEIMNNQWKRAKTYSDFEKMANVQ